MSRYVVFEGAPLYHVLESEGETACGVPVVVVSPPAGRSPKVTASKPHGVLHCGRGLKVPNEPPETSGEVDRARRGLLRLVR